MIKLQNKNIFFSGRGEKIDKEELLKYFVQNEANIVEKIEEADTIIQGYMTSSYDEDRFYLLSKNGISVIPIQQIEKEFSQTIDIDSILLAIKISKEKQRVINLLKNRYFSDEIFIKILKYYNWESDGIYDSDDNRDVATAITARFCSLVETNHNIQHSPIGIYYTALETTNPKLLEAIFHMPKYSISDKNAQKDQPLTLRQTVALNPNTPKPVLIQILKDNVFDELLFLALNNSLNKLLVDKLYNIHSKEIQINLIKSNNINNDQIELICADKELKKTLLKSIKLDDNIFTKLYNLKLSDVEYIYFCSNPTLKEKQIDILFEKEIENANINLLKNKNCSLYFIEKFLKLNDKIYNITIAHNEKLNDDIFAQLSALNDFDVDIALSFNPSTPKTILKELYKKNQETLNTGLSQNKNTPIDILMQLQIDNKYSANVSNNETYKEFSRNSLGIIHDNNSQFQRNTYLDTVI